MPTIEGEINRIHYASDDGEFVAAKIRQADHQLVSVVGPLGDPVVGQKLVAKGSWGTHDTYGKQFEVSEARLVDPDTEQGVKSYIQEFEGIGYQTAKRLTDAFGAEAIAKLDAQDAEALYDALPEHRADTIMESWYAGRDQHREEIVQLQEWGVSHNAAKKIVDEYGEDAPSQVQEDPWQLADQVSGIGFKTADGIARKLGFDFDDPKRMRAGVLYTLRHAHFNESDTYLPRHELLEKACDNLNAQTGLVTTALDWLVDEGKVIEVDWGFYMKSAWFHEKGAAEAVAACAMTPNRPIQTVSVTVEDTNTLTRRTIDKPPAGLSHTDEEVGTDDERVVGGEVAETTTLDDYELEMPDTLTDEQIQAVNYAISSGVSILTGGPGTGKTFSIETIADCATDLGLSVAICAPTGRAAKRISEVTGHQACTVHRLLGWLPDRGPSVEDLFADIVIVDEASMVDTQMAYYLFDAVPDTSSLVLVGDDDQLPSVGAGRVLAEMKSNERITVTDLTHIFRQDDGGSIVSNSHTINEGGWDLQTTGDDFCFIETEDDRQTVQGIEMTLERGVHGQFDQEDMQVISPQHKGQAGVQNLNDVVQSFYAPDAASYELESESGGDRFYVDDRVIHMENNYDLGVFNGEIGNVTGKDTSVDDEPIIEVTYPDKVVEYVGTEDIFELSLAWAITCHKSQGSEFPCIIIPISATHTWFWSRTLLYTAVTRASECVVLIGDTKTLRSAVRSQRSLDRYTNLTAQLNEAYHEYKQ